MTQHPDTSKNMQAAQRMHNAGKLSEAEALYREVLARQPTHAPALHGLGLLALQRGQPEAGAALIRQAIAVNPANPEFFAHLGGACARLGRRAEAIECYRKAIDLKPDYTEAHSGLGSALYYSGDVENAIAHFRRVLEIKPKDRQALINLAVSHQSRGMPAEALACYRRALETSPRDPDLQNAAGVTLMALGRAAEAISCYETALKANPEHVAARFNLGNALGQAGRTSEAMQCYERVAAANPSHAEAHNALGAALAQSGQPQEAIARFRRAVALNPRFFDACVNLGNSLFGAADLPGAAACYRDALALAPADAGIRWRLTDVRRHLCDWTDTPEQAAAPERGAPALASVPSPFVLLALSDSPEDQLECARLWAARHLAAFVHARPRMKFDLSRTAGERLRIGYLSADFHSHATTHLVAELFELHDRKAFEVIGYSCGPDDGSPMRRRIVAACDRFVEIASSSHFDAARAIDRDRVDILVDLKGHTRGARPQIMALRPAPVQVSFLGYPGTMGTDCYDYLVSDRFVTPPELAANYSEKLCCLPGCYQPNDRSRPIAEPAPSRQELGLPADGFVFCCFNNSYKITPEVFDIWMRLLRQVPGSALWLLDTHPDTRANLLRAAQARAVEPVRLVFAPREHLPEHLARHGRADLFLDTFPCNAHTTASDALWAGLPLLTCAGRTFCSRVAGSLLNAVGLPELVTDSLADYEALALRLAGRPDELGRLRERLAGTRLSAPLFDTPRYARNLETAYRMMWERHASGAAPAPLTVAE